MNAAQIIDRLKSDTSFRHNMTAWKTMPAREARYAGYPERLHPKLVDGLKARGITNLYTHQRDAIDAVLDGGHVCVVTPTASGKTLCYNVPVLNATPW